jgi:hypothetical protein
MQLVIGVPSVWANRTISLDHINKAEVQLHIPIMFYVPPILKSDRIPGCIIMFIWYMCPTQYL